MNYEIFGNVIKECESGLEIILKNENEIKSICKKLNGGSGFKGFTPPFFAKI